MERSHLATRPRAWITLFRRPLRHRPDFDPDAVRRDPLRLAQVSESDPDVVPVLRQAQTLLAEKGRRGVRAADAHELDLGGTPLYRLPARARRARQRPRQRCRLRARARRGRTAGFRRRAYRARRAQYERGAVLPGSRPVPVPADAVPACRRLARSSRSISRRSASARGSAARAGPRSRSSAPATTATRTARPASRPSSASRSIRATSRRNRPSASWRSASATRWRSARRAASSRTCR